MKKFTIYWIDGGVDELVAGSIGSALRRLNRHPSAVRSYEANGETFRVAGQAVCNCKYNELSRYASACVHDIALAGLDRV